MIEKGTIRKLVNIPAEEHGGKPSAFGFIKTEAGVDVFFLPSTMQESQQATWNSLKVGDHVEFKTIEHPKGLRAIDVLVRQ